MLLVFHRPFFYKRGSNAMRLTFDVYDLSFAVLVLKEMLYTKVESEDYNERLKEYVWNPTRAFFKNLAESSPRQIICFFGKQFRFPNKNGCRCRNVFIVNQRIEVAYLGTIFNKKAFDADRESMSPDDRKMLEKHPLKVSRDATYYVIPTDTDDIDELVVIKSVQKYFSSYKKNSFAIASLADVTINLLSEAKGALLDEKIRKKAKQLAKSGS